jgi:cytochrome bd-type quinol oxidase subunit 2
MLAQPSWISIWFKKRTCSQLLVYLFFLVAMYTTADSLSGRHHVRCMCRWEKLCSAMSLICELGIIASTFIFLRNEIAWQQWLKDAGHSGRSRDEVAMLIFSLVATACVIFLAIIGRGNITGGLITAWSSVRKLSAIATSIHHPMLPYLRMFKTTIHPEIHPAHKDIDPKEVNEAPAGRWHASKAISAASST